MMRMMVMELLFLCHNSDNNIIIIVVVVCLVGFFVLLFSPAKLKYFAILNEKTDCIH